MCVLPETDPVPPGWSSFKINMCKLVFRAELGTRDNCCANRTPF